MLVINIQYISLQISEKQKSLYEALERQQHYQETLQSVSTKMESIETALNEGLEPSKSPESQMAAHQVRETADQMKQDDRTKARSHKTQAYSWTNNMSQRTGLPSRLPTSPASKTNLLPRSIFLSVAFSL